MKKIIFRTQLPKNEIVLRLKSNIEIEQPYSFGINKTLFSKPFMGAINGDTFNIKRAKVLRKSVSPRILGQIVEDNEGTKIIVDIQLDSFISKFMIVWFVGILMGCVLNTYFYLTHKFPFYIVLMTLGMIPFGVLLFISPLKTERKQIQEDFKKLFEAAAE